MMQAESQSKKDTIVNIREGPGDTIVNITPENNREEITEAQLPTAQQEILMGAFDGIPSNMLDQASPPPPYQEHTDFYQSLPSAPILPSTQVLPSPPPSYSQIDLTNQHLPSATRHLGGGPTSHHGGGPSSHLGGGPSSHLGGGPTSHLGGGQSSHIPSSLRPGGTTSQLGGDRPKNQGMKKKQMTAGQAGVTSGQRIGYEWLQKVSNGQRILNVRPKEEEEEDEEMNAKGKGGVAIGVFTIVFFFLYLILPYTPFSPWD